MIYLVLVHKGNGCLNYDVFYKEDLLEGSHEKEMQGYEKTEIEYEVHECPYVKEYIKQGWEYLFSGDTAHLPKILKEMGLNDEYDVEGLRRYLRKRFPDAIIHINL